MDWFLYDGDPRHERFKTLELAVGMVQKSLLV